MDVQSHTTGAEAREPDPSASSGVGLVPRLPTREEARWRCHAVELVLRCQCGERMAGLELLARYGAQLARFHSLQRAIELHGSRKGADAYWRLFVQQDRRPYAGRNGVHALLARTAFCLRQLDGAVGTDAPDGHVGLGPEHWLSEQAVRTGLAGDRRSVACADGRRGILDEALVRMPPHPRQALLYGSILCAPAHVAAHWMGFAHETDYEAMHARARMEWLKSAEAGLRAARRVAGGREHPSTGTNSGG